MPPRSLPSRAGTLASAANAPRPFAGGQRPAAKPQARGANTAQRGNNVVLRQSRPQGGMGSTLSMRHFFGEGALGNPKNGSSLAGGSRCIGCAELGKVNVLRPMLDEYFKSGGEGPYCADCWTDKVVPHVMYGQVNMPQCEFNYRWSDTQFKQIEAMVRATMQAFQQNAKRNPLPEELNQALSNIKISEKCPFCKVDVVFTPEISDVAIKGVTVA